MENGAHLTIEAAAEAMRRLADELDATHAPPFTACFFDDHWLVLERLLSRLREQNLLPNIEERTGL